MSVSDVYLNVPLLNQWHVFPHVPKHDNMACWYTSSFMVLLYRMGAGSTANLAQIATLHRLFVNKGLGPKEDDSLAREVGFEHSPSSLLFPKKDAAEYCKALAHLGPLIFSEAKHVIVVRGCTKRVSGEPVISVNDPWGGLERTFSIGDFNKLIDWSYPIHYRRSRYEPPKALQAGPNFHPYQTKY